MQAIETSYAGYRFRSRLEARWAVFFDTLGVDYQYEPEGYEVGWRLDPCEQDGFRYLPDFWLPGLNAWLEVKGSFKHDEAWRFLNAAASICDDGVYPPEGRSIILAGDIFRQPRRGLTVPWRLVMYKGDVLATPCFLDNHFDRADAELIADDSRQLHWLDLPTLLSGRTLDMADPAYREACTRAQQARFEFGETPGRFA